MSKTLIIGASGQIGQLVTKTLAETDEPVRALVRNKSKLDHLKGSELEVIEADLEGNFSQAFDALIMSFLLLALAAQPAQIKPC